MRGPWGHLINKYSLDDCCLPWGRCDESGDAPELPGWGWGTRLEDGGSVPGGWQQQGESAMGSGEAEGVTSSWEPQSHAAQAREPVMTLTHSRAPQTVLPRQGTHSPDASTGHRSPVELRVLTPNSVRCKKDATSH